MSLAKPHLRAQHITKSFGGVQALRGVDFEVCRGEVMALVGDNGAGKSTLMKILAGAEDCSSGNFYLDGTEITIDSPHTAAALGIQIVYQDLALCGNLDVTANLFLGKELLAEGLFRFLPKAIRPLDNLNMEKRTLLAIDRLQVRTLKSIRARVGILSGGQQQAIAIARATDTDASVVLLDEPTAALGVAQSRQVLDLVKQLNEADHAIVYISHNLRDVFEISDRITVLRQGENVGVFATNQTTPDKIVSMITRGTTTN